MYAEARKSDAKYIEKDGVLSSKISTVELWYSNKNKDDDQGVRISIRPVNEEILTSESLEGDTLIREDGIDFLYSQESQNVYFIKEDKTNKLLVSITFTFLSVGTAIEKEGLLTIAKDLLN